MPTVYLNGEWLDASQARIPIDDRGFLFGDGVFETARLRRGRFFRLDRHLDRLHGSARIMRLLIPGADELTAITRELARRNHCEEGSLRLTITRGAGGRGLRREGAGPPNVLATLAPIPPGWEARAAAGWRIHTAATRRPSVDSVPAELKGLGRAYALLAYYEAEDAGFDDALMLSADGFVAEGPTWNFFWRRGRTIRTAALDVGVLEGVTRSIIMELSHQAGFSVEEGSWPREELDHADELFATMTSSGLVPFRALDARQIALGEDSAVALLQARYWELVDREVRSAE